MLTRDELEMGGIGMLLQMARNRGWTEDDLAKWEEAKAPSRRQWVISLILAGHKEDVKRAAELKALFDDENAKPRQPDQHPAGQNPRWKPAGEPIPFDVDLQTGE
jgi:hypothetical protein